MIDSAKKYPNLLLFSAQIFWNMFIAPVSLRPRSLLWLAGFWKPAQRQQNIWIRCEENNELFHIQSSLKQRFWLTWVTFTSLFEILSTYCFIRSDLHDSQCKEILIYLKFAPCAAAQIFWNKIFLASVSLRLNLSSDWSDSGSQLRAFKVDVKKIMVYFIFKVWSWDFGSQGLLLRHYLKFWPFLI